MTLVFDARDIPEADRAEVVLHTIAEGFFPVEIDFDEDRGPVAAHFVVSDWGDLRVCSSVSTAVTVRRTAALTHDDSAPSVFVSMQMSGSSVMVQRDRQVVVRPGDLVVYDSTTPWLMADRKGIRQHKFRIPAEQLALSYDIINSVCAVTLSPGDPIADLAARYFHRLATDQTSFDSAGGEAVSRPSIELLRAVIATHVNAAELARGAMEATLSTRIMTYARTHLHDLNLSAEQIAAEHHISVRLLYKYLRRRTSH